MTPWPGTPDLSFVYWLALDARAWQIELILIGLVASAVTVVASLIWLVRLAWRGWRRWCLLARMVIMKSKAAKENQHVLD